MSGGSSPQFSAWAIQKRRSGSEPLAAVADLTRPGNRTNDLSRPLPMSFTSTPTGRYPEWPVDHLYVMFTVRSKRMNGQKCTFQRGQQA